MAATLEAGGQWPAEGGVRLPQRLDKFSPELAHPLRDIEILDFIFRERAATILPFQMDHR